MNIYKLKKIIHNNTKLPNDIIDIITEYTTCKCNRNKKNYHHIYYVKCQNCENTEITSIRASKYYCYNCSRRIIPTYLKKKCKICHNCIPDKVFRCLECYDVLIKYDFL